MVIRSRKMRRPIFSGASRPLLALLYCSQCRGVVSQGTKPRSPVEHLCCPMCGIFLEFSLSFSAQDSPRFAHCFDDFEEVVLSAVGGQGGVVTRKVACFCTRFSASPPPPPLSFLLRCCISVVFFRFFRVRACVHLVVRHFIYLFFSSFSSRTSFVLFYFSIFSHHVCFLTGRVFSMFCVARRQYTKMQQQQLRKNVCPCETLLGC